MQEHVELGLLLPQPVEGATRVGDHRRQPQMAELLAAGSDLDQELTAVAEQLGQDRHGRRPGERAIAGDGRRVEPIGSPPVSAVRCRRTGLVSRPEARAKWQSRAEPRGCPINEGGVDPEELRAKPDYANAVMLVLDRTEPHRNLAQPRYRESGNEAAGKDSTATRRGIG
jgi:hypothetical protein